MRVSAGVMKAVSASLPNLSGAAMEVTMPTTRRVCMSKTGAPEKPGVISELFTCRTLIPKIVV
jgi:hypothetical protein